MDDALKLAPILLFGYKRPQHIKKCLESLAQNKESSGSDLYVFIDGPKTVQDAALVEEVSTVAASQKWCRSVSVYANKENRGVPAQVIGAVTEFCKKHGKVIVLEDDLVLSPHFLGFINVALEKYADDPRVMEVTGYLYPVKGLRMASGFLRGSCGWGWGTWERAWRHFEKDGTKIFAELKQNKLFYDFNFNNAGHFTDDLKKQIKGQRGGWDIRWYGSCFLQGGLTLYPRHALVKNIGFDNTGLNTYRTRMYDVEMGQLPVTQFPESVEETRELFLATVKYFRSSNSLARKVVDRFRNMLVP